MSNSNLAGTLEVAALLAEREHLRAMLWMMPVGIFIVDEQGRFVETNPAAEALWGEGLLPRVGLEGYHLLEGYWPGSDRRLAPHEWALARTLRDGQPVMNEEVDITAFDGTRRTVLCSTASLKDEQGTILGAVAVQMDITTRRQAEQAGAAGGLPRRLASGHGLHRLFQRAEQSVAARDEFVAIATHELRTPLSVLSLQLLSLQRAVDASDVLTSERLRHSLAKARRQTKSLEQLVHRLLDVSRISTGHLELELEEVDLSELVRCLVMRFEEKLAEAGITPEVRANAPVVARVDRPRVEQVLMNLLSNAMKYAPGQPVELDVEREGREVVIGVRDHGPGISPEAQARIFERYQRASGQHSRESLGLGLYVSRQIARAHGGELTVESTPGQGACFRLRLPLASDPATLSP
jgi:PAS domain S-box-containing protein